MDDVITRIAYVRIRSSCRSCRSYSSIEFFVIDVGKRVMCARVGVDVGVGVGVGVCNCVDVRVEWDERGVEKRVT